MRDMIVSLRSRFSVSFFFLFPQSKGYLALGLAHLEILAFKGGQFYSVLGAGGWEGGVYGVTGSTPCWDLHLPHARGKPSCRVALLP